MTSMMDGTRMVDIDFHPDPTTEEGRTTPTRTNQSHFIDDMDITIDETRMVDIDFHPDPMEEEGRTTPTRTNKSHCIYDMDIILERITTKMDTQMILNGCRDFSMYRPKAHDSPERDLTIRRAMTIYEEDDEDDGDDGHRYGVDDGYHQYTTALTSLQERMDAFLGKELARIHQLDVDQVGKKIDGRNDILIFPTQSNDSMISNTDDGDLDIKLKSSESDKTSTTINTTTATAVAVTTMVWTVQPLYSAPTKTTSSDGGPRFRFATTTTSSSPGRPYLTVRGAWEALACIEIIKKRSIKSSCTALFQLYSMDGTEWSVVGLDDITSHMQVILNEEAQKVLMVGGNVLATITTDSDGFDCVLMMPRRPRYHPFIHRMMRRRWKRIIRRQMALTLDGSTTSKRRGWLSIHPTSLIGKSVSHQESAL